MFSSGPGMLPWQVLLWRCSQGVQPTLTRIAAQRRLSEVLEGLLPAS
jgi:hypothetical protein